MIIVKIILKITSQNVEKVDYYKYFTDGIEAASWT